MNEGQIDGSYSVQRIVGSLNLFTFPYREQVEQPAKYLHVISACGMKDTLNAWECAQKNHFVSHIKEIDVQRVSYEGVECAVFNQGVTETGKNSSRGIAKLVCAKKGSSLFFITESAFEIGIRGDTIARIYKTKGKLHLVLVNRFEKIHAKTRSEDTVDKVTMKLPEPGHFMAEDKLGYSKKDSDVFRMIDRGQVFGRFDNKENHRSLKLGEYKFKGIELASSTTSSDIKFRVYLEKAGTHYKGTVTPTKVSVKNTKMSLSNVEKITPGLFKQFEESSAHRKSQLGFPVSMDQTTSKCGIKEGFKEVVFGSNDEHFFLSYNPSEEKVALCTKDETKHDLYLPLEEFSLKIHSVKEGDRIEVASFKDRKI